MKFFLPRTFRGRFPLFSLFGEEEKGKAERDNRKEKEEDEQDEQKKEPNNEHSHAILFF